MKLKIYHIDAFADRLFSGNPAAVCPLDEWLPDELMQHMAQENNLSETAFFVPGNDAYELRWFTPEAEVDLCGHATLASAYVIFNDLNYRSERITFNTRSGKLLVEKQGNSYSLDLPSQPPIPCTAPEGLAAALGAQPKEVLAAEDLLAVLDSHNHVKKLIPDFNLLKSLPLRGLIVTSPGVEADFVSRCFYPKLGVNEDPVTGSAHCTLIPYWAERLGKPKLTAHQISARGGKLHCELRSERVLISGEAIKYLEGTIEIQV